MLFVVIHVSVKGGDKLLAVLVIAALQQDHELVSADAVNGTMSKLTAYHHTAFADETVALLVAEGIVDVLQAVDIEHDHAEFPFRIIRQTFVYAGDHFNISAAALDAREGIGIGGCGDEVQLLSGLHFLPEQFFQLLAVFRLFILVDEGVEQTGPEHTSHGIKGQQRVVDLNEDQRRHHQAEHAYGAVSYPFDFGDLSAEDKSVQCSEREQEYLESEQQIAYDRRCIFALLVDIKQK